MRRREFVMLVAGAASWPGRLAGQTNGAVRAAFWHLFKSWGSAEASEEQTARALAALADAMFPGDGLPGASALGIHRRVLEMAELRESIATGVGWLDAHAAREGATDFASLDEAHRLAALDAAFASRDDGIQSLVLALRFHLGTAYYRDPRVKSAFAYTGPPQPDGFADFGAPPA
jgi:hypothetical protein